MHVDRSLFLRICSVGMLLGMALSWPLWSARTHFPLLPLWGEAWLPPEGGLENLKVGAVCVLLAIFVVFPRNKTLQIALLCIFPLWVCSDLTKMQPWVWFYWLAWLLLLLPKGEAAEDRSTIIFLLSGMYFWSGFSKLTPWFADDNFAWFCEAFTWTQPLAGIPCLGYLPGLLECGVGLALLSGRGRHLLRWTLPVFHAVIALFLIKNAWNAVVLPWNVVIAVLAWLALAQPYAPLWQRPFSVKKQRCALIFALPGLSFFGLWPHNLSWKLYDNTQPEITFLLYDAPDPNDATAAIFRKYGADDRKKMLGDDWCMGELHVPMCYQMHCFRQLHAHLCTRLRPGALDKSAVLRVQPRGGVEEIFYLCGDK
jgi:hypothetical protein